MLSVDPCLWYQLCDYLLDTGSTESKPIRMDTLVFFFSKNFMPFTFRDVVLGKIIIIKKPVFKNLRPLFNFAAISLGYFSNFPVRI